MLPIVHVNGFKISERTIYGTMDDKEMLALFTYVSLPALVVIFLRGMQGLWLPGSLC